MNNPNILFISLPYATKEFHIGRIGGSFIPADVFKKYHQIFHDRKSFLISGLDCYGTDVYLKSKIENMSPDEYISSVNVNFKKVLEFLGIELMYNFTTNSIDHQLFVQKHLESLYQEKRLHIEPKLKMYCSNCDIFLADRFLVDSTGKPHEKLVESNQSPVLPFHCKLCSREAQEKRTNTLILDYLPQLSQKYQTTKKTINVTQTNKELSRTKCPWGLPNSDLMNSRLGSQSTCYVWIEALLSYLEQYKQLLLPTEANLVAYFYAKDNKYYHEIILPQLIANESISTHHEEVLSFCRNYFLFSKEKMSSSAGNCLDPLEIGVPGDLLRFAISKLDTLNSDKDISRQKIVKYSKDYFKEYVNLIKRIDGLSKTNRVTKESSLDINPSYHKWMNENDLSKSLDLVHNFYIEISKKLDSSLKEGSTINLIPELYTDCKKLFLYLKPFTPSISSKILEILEGSKNFRYDIDSYSIIVE